jgi:hypothetical protein
VRLDVLRERDNTPRATSGRVASEGMGRGATVSHE